MNQQPRKKGSVTTNISNGIGYGILVCFVIGAILGYLQHDYARWFSVAVPFGVGLGVLGGMVADRRQRKAR